MPEQNRTRLTFSGNSVNTFIGKLTTQYIIKNKKKIFTDLEKKSSLFQKEVNTFIKANNINAKMYRFKSMLRIIFSNKKIINRFQRDMFERKNLNNIERFRNFLIKNGIHYPSNGKIFISTATSYQDLKIITKLINKGLKQFIK